MVYWRYITSRAEAGLSKACVECRAPLGLEALNLFVHTASHLVLARLACLTRSLALHSESLMSLMGFDVHKDAWSRKGSWSCRRHG